MDTVVEHPDASRPSQRIGAGEVCLLGLTLAGAILLVEILTAARGGLEYLDGARPGGAGFDIGAAYALLFGATCLAGWLIARLTGRGVARRSEAVFLGLSVSVVPVFGGALAIHPAVSSLLWNWSIAPLFGTLALAATLVLGRIARSGSTRAREFATAFLISCLLGLAAGVAAARQQDAIAMLRLEHHAWLSLAEAALLAMPIGLGLSLALRGLHVGRSVRRLIATSALFPSLCSLAVYGLLFLKSNPMKPTSITRSPSPSVLLIMIDTLRADFVSGAGGFPGATPAIEALAREGIVFGAAHSAAPWTLSSVGSILTSTYPSQHRAGLRDPKTERRFGLSPALPTLAESLHVAGYVTGAALTNSYLSPRYGLGRGFDAYENVIGTVFYHPVYRWLLQSLNLPMKPYVIAEPQERRVLSMLDRLARTGRPFFLLAHFMDPHGECRAPEAFYDKPEGQRTLVDDYRAEVRYVDHAIGDLLESLRARGAYDDLLIVLTSDHGEELLEGRPRTAETAGFRHGHTLYEELLHVPLIVKLPHGRLAGTHRAELVSGIDLAPTILGAVGVSSPRTFGGLDLFDENGGAARLRDRVIFSEGMMLGPELQTARRGNYKVIQPAVPLGAEVAQVFDLGSDPLEKRPITNPDEFAGYAALEEPLLMRARAEWDHLGAENPVDLSAVQLELLKALGYVAGSHTHRD